MKKIEVTRKLKKKKRVAEERGKSITLLNSVLPPFTPKLRPKSLSRELTRIVN